MLPWKETADLIETRSSFVIASHEEPDGDAVGSSIALASLLSRKGKNVILCSPGPFARTEIAEYEDLFLPEAPPEFLHKEPVIMVLDASSPERIGTFSALAAEHVTIVIDHHASGAPFGTIRCVDSGAPSTTFLIQRLFEILGIEPSQEEARMLLFGLCTDTGFFRHAEENSGEVLAAAAKLASRGVSLKEIHGMIYSGKPFESRVLLGRTLAGTERHFSGQVLFTYESLEDHRRYGLQNRDSDILYQLLQGTRECRAVAYIREEGENFFSVGLRSTDTIDVGALAQAHGGGGHKKAASFRFSGTGDEVRELLLKEFSRLLDTADRL